MSKGRQLLELWNEPQPYPGALLFGLISLGLGTLVLSPIRHAVNIGPEQFVRLGLGAVLILPGVFMTLVFVRGLRQELSLSREGVTVDAAITKVREESGKYKGKEERWWVVEFRYNDLYGKEYQKEVVIEDPDEASHLSVGARHKIKINPRRPDYFRWLG